MRSLKWSFSRYLGLSEDARARLGMLHSIQEDTVTDQAFVDAIVAFYASLTHGNATLMSDDVSVDDRSNMLDIIISCRSGYQALV